ncbi:unnamed protein product [Caretta caretta]
MAPSGLKAVVRKKILSVVLHSVKKEREWKSVQALINDFQGTPTFNYKAVHVFFLSPCPEPLFKELRKSRITKVIKTLKEINMAFLPYESRACKTARYSTRLPFTQPPHPKSDVVVGGRKGSEISDSGRCALMPGLPVAVLGLSPDEKRRQAPSPNIEGTWESAAKCTPWRGHRASTTGSAPTAFSKRTSRWRIWQSRLPHCVKPWRSIQPSATGMDHEDNFHLAHAVLAKLKVFKAYEPSMGEGGEGEGFLEKWAGLPRLGSRCLRNPTVLPTLGVDKENLTKLIQLANIQQQRDIIHNMLFLGISLTPGSRQLRPKRKARLESSYQLSHWIPMLRDIMEDILEDKLDKSLWPFVSDPVPTTSSQAAVSSRFRHWHKNKPATEYQTGPRLIIYVLGGVSMSEMRCAYELTPATRGKWEVVIGSSHILTPKRFLDDIQTLNQLDPEEA